MSLVFSRDDRSHRALHGIDEQPKERRRSKLRKDRDELLDALKDLVMRSVVVPSNVNAVAYARALIARIEQEGKEET